MVWKLADAKNNFSKVVDKALAEGPQKVTRRNEAIMVVAFEDFESLRGKKKGFREYLMGMPSLEGVLLERDRSRLREVAL